MVDVYLCVARNDDCADRVQRRLEKKTVCLLRGVLAYLDNVFDSVCKHYICNGKRMVAFHHRHPPANLEYNLVFSTQKIAF